MSCLFQLENYKIEHVVVVLNEEYDASLPTHTGNIASSLNVAPHKKDPLRYRLTLDVRIDPTEKREKEFFPYRVAIKGRAAFAFKDGCSREEIDKFMRLNGAAILYGLLRAQIAQITAQSVHGQFLLPTMNFAEAAKDEPKAKANKVLKKGEELPKAEAQKGS